MIDQGFALVVAALLIVLNGCLVAYEFAIIAAKRSAFEAPAVQGRRIPRAALDAMSDLSIQLAGAQLAITTVTLALGYVGEPAVEGVIESWLGTELDGTARQVISFVAALIVVSFLHLVVGEMVPKNVAIASPELTVRWLVLPAKVYVALFGPLIRLLHAIANRACRLVGVEPLDELSTSHSAAELALIFRQSSDDGGLERDSADRLRGALDFAERTVGAAATPLGQIPTIRRGATFAAAEQAIVTHGVTRLPMSSVSRGVNRVVGYVHAKDLLVDADRHAPIPDSLRRDMVVVEPATTLVQALRMLKQQRLQLALVAERSGPVGVISVDEIVEALTEASKRTE